jgi:hypothetical protein
LSFSAAGAGGLEGAQAGDERTHLGDFLDELLDLFLINPSDDALSILDRYQIRNANEPMAILIGTIDRMNANQREVISRFEPAIALAGIEFGRIDLAIQKAEEIQQQVESLAVKLDRTQKDFALRMDKIRQRSNSDILMNHLNPFIYCAFGAVVTLLGFFVLLRVKTGL